MAQNVLWSPLMRTFQGSIATSVSQFSTFAMIAVAVVVFVGCGATPDDVAPDANLCAGLAESACNAQVGCYAEYSTSNESGQIGGDFVTCATGSATCSLPAGCGFGGVGCPQGLTVAFTLENPSVCDAGVDTSCVHLDKCSP